MGQYTLPDGRIRVQVDVGKKFNGKRDRRTSICSDKETADKVEAEFLEIKELNKKRPSSILFSEYVESYFWPAKSSLAEVTKRGYHRDLKLRLTPFFGHMDIRDIKRHHIQKMIDSCPTQKTATNARETMSSIMGLACEDELIDKNPCSCSFRYPKAVAKAQASNEDKGVLLSSYSQHKLFLEKVNLYHGGEMLEYISILGLCFGLRPSEIYGLDWDNVFFDKKAIYVCQGFSDGMKKPDPPKTPNAYRFIGMTDYAYRKLLELFNRYDDSNRPISVISRRNGLRYSPSTARQQMSRFTLGHSDVPNVTIHSLRHSFGTAAILAGTNVKIVSMLMGHCDIYVTINRYVKPLQEDLNKGMQAISDCFEVA